MTADPLTAPSRAIQSNGSRVRALIAVIVLGLVSTLLVVLGIESTSQTRKMEKAGAPPAGESGPLPENPIQTRPRSRLAGGPRPTAPAPAPDRRGEAAPGTTGEPSVAMHRFTDSKPRRTFDTGSE